MSAAARGIARRPGAAKPRRRWPAQLALGLALFTTVVWLTFPTTRLVRAALDRVVRPGLGTVTFRDASVRPWGLTVYDFEFIDVAGRRPVRAAWVRLRPSLWGLVTGRSGRPWLVAAGMCGGTIETHLDVDGSARAVDATWSDVDVATCLGMVPASVAVTGRSSGQTVLTWSATAAPVGSGSVSLRDGTWQPPLEELEELPIHADAATVDWNLTDKEITVTTLTVRGPDVDVSAQGNAQLAGTLGASPLRMRVTLRVMPDAPAELRRLTSGLPRRADGAHDFMVTGTLDVPKIAPR